MRRNEQFFDGSLAYINTRDNIYKSLRIRDVKALDKKQMLDAFQKKIQQVNIPETEDTKAIVHP